ncbi:hypothetical protein DVH24_040523 [Malus domestica]|uniref:Uncharacterized protein n=1 Tax=Malus domestica TaxID=3750 RepID=A0A498I7G5_MALDO|nr:hypothetical protein DVH24_040523 [Malus domestica]
MVLQGVSENHPLGELVQAYLELWNCELGHVYDEMHLVAEELANLSLSYSFGPMYFTQAPTSCRHLLLSDVAEISKPCNALL